MTIYELGDMMNADLVLRRYAMQGNRWMAMFEHGEIKDGCCLAGICGNSKTPQGAITDYVRQIRGRVIVFDAWDGKRREYGVPDTLSD